MTKFVLSSLFASTALSMAMPSMVMAQVAPEDSDAEAAENSNEIIVTARRANENLQDVPVSVQIVTGDRLDKLAITSVEEISKLAPGLTLVNAGSNTSVTLRGVTWQPGSGTPASPIYFNEIGFDPAQTIVSLFDVGQIEVLRGPQGTARGAPSISGAITIQTRKPDLQEFGGFVRGQYGEGDHTDFQGAVNIPIIKDVLAIRLAANIEDSNGTRVESVNSTIQSTYKDRSYRATVLLQPTDNLSFQAMYQRRKSLGLNFTQVAGTGSPGLAGIPTIRAAIPANFNGPALTVADRRSVQDAPQINDQHVDLLTFNASWELFGQKLSYNFGKQFNRSGPTLNATDVLNILPGFETRTSVTNNGLPEFRIHEVRLASTPDDDRPFDYDLGWYSRHSGGGGLNFGAPTYLNGAFGNPITTTPGAVTTPDSRYVLDSSTNILLGQRLDTFYGNVRFRLGEKTELSGGLAIIRDTVPVTLAINTSAALSSTGSFAGIRGGLLQAANAGLFDAAFGGSRAAALGFLSSPTLSCEQVRGFIRQPTAVTSTINPGTCDISIPAGPRPGQVNNDRYTKAIYNFSLSHKFTDDLLAYATVGSSFRSGLPAINNPGLPADLVTPEPESATSYEIGFKSSIGSGLTVNGAVFQLDYKDQLTTFEGIQYFNTVSN
nr:TonB-dependent receptor plug domain-containing protein [Sphingorhabdus sp.]